MRPRLRDQYDEVIRPELRARFSYTNFLQVPRLDKIVINMGVGEAAQDTKKITPALEELTLISGQKPLEIKARRSVANFKLREGQAIGCSVTLRGVRQWEFLDRLLSVALPRVRDFSGVSPKTFDGRGNYTLGVREQTIFPEVDYDKVEKVTGMNVTMVTTAQTDAEAKALLTYLGVPFRQ